MQHARGYNANINTTAPRNAGPRSLKCASFSITDSIDMPLKYVLSLDALPLLQRAPGLLALPVLLHPRPVL